MVLVTTTVPWLTDDEQRTWRSFVAATRLLFDQLDRELQRDAGMTHADYEILVRLSEAPSWRLRMSDLADASESSRSRLSHAVARLEERGWIRRQVCEEDGRGQLAILTDDGFVALEAAAPVHVESVRRHLFDQLSPQQVAAMRDIGETLLQHLSPR